MQPSLVTVVLLPAAAALVALTTGCRRTAEAERRASAEATAAAEDIAQEASLTSAALEAGEVATTSAAFKLEQSDYRARLARALDRLDEEITRGREAARASPARGRSRARRELLRTDLEAIDRSTEQDWATLRMKVERDLDKGRPVPHTDRKSGEAP